ncbi:MAG: gliding motility protein GldM [Bacteroidia bacterium]|nr:gliding motility protein GldM [Bacteroidia bacterium]MCF8426005.1 gliding motility protein GldM [Bacteroidia bacterium]MCF8445400.1 gliding motility protein GldM [Bacteroidia bacterium]
MAGGKVTVRQKMINMMYLVLTALLALNVSAEILKSFHMVEVSMDRAGMNIDKKNENTLKAIAQYHKDIPTDPTGTDVFNKSLQVKKIADEGVKYFTDLKNQLIEKAGGRKDGNPDEEVAQASNIELHANLMINQGKGKEVKAKIDELNKKLIEILPQDKRNVIKSDLITEIKKGSNQTWESEMFEHTPLAAVVALMSKTQNDIKNTEAQVLDELRSSLTANVMIIDQLTPQIIPVNGTNITLGNKYQAEIFLAASSSRSEASISVNGTQLKNESGIGKYEVTASREGENKFKAVITTVNSSGKKETYEKEGSFFALAPLAVISATKMNVVYIGLDNPISVSVPGFAANKVDVRCEGGSIKKVGSGGEYVLTVDGKNREVKISASVDGKTMGFATYRVRQIPKPTPMLGPIEQSGSVSMGQLKSANFVLTVLKDFAFEGVTFTPISWNLVYQPKNGPARVENGSGQNLTPGAKNALMNARPGDRFILMNIKAKGPAGAVPIPASLALEVRQ